MATPIRKTHPGAGPHWPGTWRTEDPQQWATCNARPLMVVDHQLTRRTRCHYLYLPGEAQPLVEPGLCALLAAVRAAGYTTAAVVHDHLPEDGVPDDLLSFPPLR